MATTVHHGQDAPLRADSASQKHPHHHLRQSQRHQLTHMVEMVRGYLEKPKIDVPAMKAREAAQASNTKKWSPSLASVLLPIALSSPRDIKNHRFHFDASPNALDDA
jgi:hypothetical protein